MKRKVFSVLILVILSLFVGLAEGVTLDRTMLHAPAASAQGSTPAAAVAAPATSTPAPSGPDLALLKQAWDTLQQHYVDRPALDSTQLTYGAISGMVNALGDTGHSRFLTPEMVHQEDNFNKGQFEGIGAEVDSKDGNLTIVAPIDGSPAQKAGLKPGEIIAKVDGKDISGLPLSQAVTLILGPAGTKVTLTIVDPATGATRDVTLTRANITLHSVTWQRLPGTSVAHLRLAAFTPDVTKDMEKALTDMQQQGITGVVLDLRSDPGGLLNEAIGAASEFLSSGNVLQEKDAQGNIKVDRVRPGGVATTIPVVVLTDQGTASAAEILASALQDAGRAKIVGQTTFGTGTVLQRFPLSDGSAELIATSEWLTRDGRELWRHGVTPDVVVALPAGVQPLIPEAEHDLTAAGLQNSKDAQLLMAISILQAPSAKEATAPPAARQ